MKYTEEEIKKCGIKSIQIIGEADFASKLLIAHYDGYQESYELSKEVIQNIRNGSDSDIIIENLIDKHMIKYKKLNEI